MEGSPSTARVFRFGIFELDARSGELRRHGLKVRLPDQSFQILQVLLDRPGDVVTREELRQRLWTSGTFVDFDVGLNSAVRKLREALDDSADSPRFVETLPRRGYRFIAPVTPARPDQIPVPSAGGTETAASPLFPAWIAAGLVVAATIATLALAYESGWWEGPQAVAGAIQGPVASSSSARGGHPRAGNPEANDSYQKGIFAGGRGSYEGFRTAVAYFEEAVARQPDFAAAYAALAQAQHQFLFAGPLSPRETMPKAEAAARKALALDETLAQAHQTLGGILHHFSWQWDEGDKEFERARQLRSSSFAPVAPAGIPALIRNGRFEEAIALTERARKNDPLAFNTYMNLATAYRAAGRYDQAVAEIRRALEVSPGQNRANFQLGVTFMFMGRLNDAISELETAVRLARGGNPRFQAYLGYAYVAAGRPLDARRILTELEALARQQYVSSFGLALIYDVLGEREPALAAFERAYQDRAVEFAQMDQYRPFKTIASEPRFQALMRRIGLPR